MRKRELKRSIIRMIRLRGMYGYELWKDLASEGETVQLSYLYKTLSEMSKEGLLVSRLQPGEHGPKTRQYVLTARGRRELGKIFGEATELIHDFYEEYFSKLPPEFFSDRFNRMMREVYGGRESVAFVVSEPLTHLHREILESVCRRSGGKHTYLVKPSHIKAPAEVPDMTVLDGAFDDIPLRDKSLDGVIVVDIQDAANLKRSCREFRRVLKEGGVVVGCSPFMGLGGVNDPLEVGEFMKKMKYTWSGRAYPDRESIKKALAETFDYVDVANMGFVTGFVSGLKPIRTRSG